MSVVCPGYFRLALRLLCGRHPFYPPPAAGFDGFLASVRGRLPALPPPPARGTTTLSPHYRLQIRFYWYDSSVLFRCYIFTLLSQNIGIFWAIVSGCCGVFGGGPTLTSSIGGYGLTGHGIQCMSQGTDIFVHTSLSRMSLALGLRICLEVLRWCPNRVFPPVFKPHISSPSPESMFIVLT
jgi:hypothetical protein